MFPSAFFRMPRKFLRNIKPPKMGLKNKQKPKIAHLEYIAFSEDEFDSIIGYANKNAGDCFYSKF
jgi:hypothetical protein